MSGDGERSSDHVVVGRCDASRVAASDALFIIETDGPSSQSSAAFHHDVPVRGTGPEKGGGRKAGELSRRLKERGGFSGGRLLIH